MISWAQVSGQTKQLQLWWTYLLHVQAAFKSQETTGEEKRPHHLWAPSALIVNPPMSVSPQKTPHPALVQKLHLWKKSLPVCLGQLSASFASLLHMHTLPLWAHMVSLSLSGFEPEPAAKSAIFKNICLPPSCLLQVDAALKALIHLNVPWLWRQQRNNLAWSAQKQKNILRFNFKNVPCTVGLFISTPESEDTTVPFQLFFFCYFLFVTKGCCFKQKCTISAYI